MGHAHAHGHHGHAHGQSFRKPSKEVKAIVLTGLQSSIGDPTRARQALAPLAMDSPVLFALCGQLVDAGQVDQATALLAQTRTRMPGGILALLIVGPIVFAGLLTAVILFLTLGR